MKNSSETDITDNSPTIFRFDYLAMVLASVLTLIATFFVSSSSLGFGSKTIIFSAIVALYLIFSGRFYYWKSRQHASLQAESEFLSDEDETEGDFSSEVEEKLHVLEQANSFFSSSLKFADMFRLVSNRIEELAPFTTCVLFMPDENRTKIKIVQAAGENAHGFQNFETDYITGLAGNVFLSQQIQVDENLQLERGIFDEAILENLKSAVGVPLCDASYEVYGVLVLYSNSENNFDLKTVKLLEEISTRISPLFLNSLAHEKSLENALKDTLTNLPNERAFHLVLETQIAESQRFRDQRALTVLSIDIKDFDELNKKYGHATGDKVLALSSKIMKGQLRQMDFLSRSMGDEFLAVLPTASEEITKVIIDRIEKAFKLNPFEISKEEKIQVQLNFGMASFLKDGETAQDLLRRAIFKKQESKSNIKSSVLWFSREFAN